MELDDRALPLTRRQLDIWLAQETGDSDTECQPVLFARIEGPVKPDLLGQAISKVAREAQPCRAAFSLRRMAEFPQRAIDNPDLGLARYDFRCSRHPVRAAHRHASAIQRTPIPFTRPLFKFASSRTRPDEYYWFVDFVPFSLTVSLAGFPATATYTAFGPVGHFRLFFLLGPGDQHFLSTVPPMFEDALARPGGPNKQIELQHAYENTGREVG